jgi:hypothetical protein
MINILFFLSLLANSLQRVPKSKGYLNKVEMDKEYMVTTGINTLDHLNSNINEVSGKLAMKIPRTCSERANFNIGCGAGYALSFLQYFKFLN